MSQILTLRQITKKISHLEEEISILRKELDELRQEETRTSTTSATQVASAWADKKAQRHWINQLFTSLSITNKPIGFQALQQRMSQSGLSHNELSRSIVEAREE